MIPTSAAPSEAIHTDPRVLTLLLRLEDERYAPDDDARVIDTPTAVMWGDDDWKIDEERAIRNQITELTCGTSHWTVALADGKFEEHIAASTYAIEGGGSLTFRSAGGVPVLSYPPGSWKRVSLRLPYIYSPIAVVRREEL
jgi:hypothetical protein